jgi:hypothetical protein
MRRNPLMITAGVLVLTVTAVVAVKYVRTYVSSASAGSPPAATAPSDGTDDEDAAAADPSAQPSDGTPGDPAQQARFQSGAELVQKAKGHLGIIVRDRKSGAEWRAGEVDHPTWTGATIKLAMAANLLERGRTGEIKLDTTARSSIAAMLDTSSDPAAETLWTKFGRDAFVPWFQQQYGMTGVQFPAGVTHDWSTLKGTPDDLLHLISYVLDQADPGERDYLMAAMRRVGTVQHWGIWAAGPANQPGVKNAWTQQTDDRVRHWVTHSVGFAGPDARYAIAVMFDEPGGATLATGVHTVSDVIATIFGVATPATVTVPPNATGG